MTELYFLDENFRIMEGPVEDMTSVVWSERYFGTGTFTFHFPRELVKRISGAVYVRSGKNPVGEVFCGRIEYLRTDNDGDCEMGGHFLECLLADRVIPASVWSGTLTEALLAAVQANLRNSPVVIGDLQENLTDQVTLTARWESMADWMTATLRPCGASYRVTLDENDVPVLNVVRGRDLSSDHCSQPVIFSASYGNIFSIETERDSASMKNAVYVEGQDGNVVFADHSGGGAVREMYQKAADIKPGDFDSEDAYRDALLRRGGEILAKHPAVLDVRAEIDGTALPVYGVDYRLGDVCDVVDEESGIRTALRLTRVDWVTENGSTAVYPVFGV